MRHVAWYNGTTARDATSVRRFPRYTPIPHIVGSNIRTAQQALAVQKATRARLG